MAVGQAYTWDTRPVGLRLSVVALAGHRPFAIRCPAPLQRTGHAVMHSSTIVPPGATSVVPCSECWETRRSLATMGLPAGRVHWKTVSTRIVGRRADERGMVRKHPSRTPGVRFALASCGKG